jgi:hypothetical protein
VPALEEANPLAVIAKHQEAPPVDPGAIARYLGLVVSFMPLGPEVAGQLMRVPRLGRRPGWHILINSADHPNRQRFTLAHEVAHYVLHRDLIESGVVDDTMYRSALGSGYETQANRLAADILMPVGLVAKWRQRIPDAKDLARAFQVSPAAMDIRLKGIDRAAGQGSLPF